MSETDVWMPLYIGDYLADTQRLTAEQHGAYLLLIMDYWRNGPPPADDGVLGQITRLDRVGWRRHRKTLRGFFREVEGRLVHKRIEEELAEALLKKEAVAARSSRAAQARWKKEASGDARAVLKHSSSTSLRTSSSTPQAGAQAVLEQCPSPSPSPSPSPPEQGDVLSGSDTPSAPSPQAGSAPKEEESSIFLRTEAGTQFEATAELAQRWQAQFPAVEVAQQLRQMQAWLEANPGNRKTERGMKRFIVGWLGREQDRACRAAHTQPASSAGFLGEGDVL